MRREVGSGDRPATSRVGVPRIEPPQDLVVREFDADGERFALFEWASATPSAAALAALTPAEAAVAALAAAGHSNAQIAGARRAATRTVANQLASAFRKLGVRSRAELCARLWTTAPAAGGRER
ncbi:MAG TPA: LuxR C-terminal-related transcriptional regulator [Anaeromyxobacter sp.]